MTTEQTVAAGTVVAIHYSLTVGGQVVDSSQGREPLSYLHGHGNIVPGLEAQISGKNSGDKFAAEVAPSEGYGDRDAEGIQQVPRSAFPDDAPLEVGMQLQVVDQDDNPRLIQIVEVADDNVTVDMNHPLAGQTLNFDIEVVSVRTATAEELEHGHVHGDDCGHDH